jgi:ABC-type transport system involved in multi-copper enzyme maturation permease subunit
MIWLSWRQFRAQAWTALAAMAVIAITFAITGPHLTYLFAASGIAACHADCGTLASNFMNQMKGSINSVLYGVGIGVLYLAPAAMGIFWGAPLVTRELEAGTFRLTWNQSITRTRWIAVKLGLVGLASMAAAGLFSLMVTWWASPIDRASGLAAGRDGASSVSRLAPLLFGARGITPIGYAAFAFALGVTVGVLIRRTVPAMAITLVVFAAVQIVMPLWVRPHIIAPVHTVMALNAANINGLESSPNNSSQMTVFAAVNIPGAWILSNHVTTAAGQTVFGPAPQVCNTSSFQACTAALGRLHLKQVVTYQPASRYWALQWYETAIFVIVALALAGFCVWWVRRRRLS